MRPTLAISGHGVDDAGDDLVVHVPGLAGQDFGHRDALVLGLVGEHRPAHDVADGEDAGDVGLEVLVDDDAAALERHARLGEAEPVGVGPAADGDEHHVGLEHLLASPPLAGSTVTFARLRGLDLGDLGAEQELDALLLS